MPVFRPPPGAGSQPFDPLPPKAAPPAGLGWLPFIFGAGAIFWLVQLARFAAIAAAPRGRDQLGQAFVQAGATTDVAMYVAVEVIIVLFYVIAAASLHATASPQAASWGWTRQDRRRSGRWSHRDPGSRAAGPARVARTTP
jgi:hypothetical protein